VKKLYKIVIRFIGLFIPVRNVIYLESKPVFSDNTFRLYEQMLGEKINEHYKIIWFYDEYDFKHNSFIPQYLPKNVSVIKINNSTLAGKIKKMICLCNGKIYISSNLFYGGVKRKQFNLHLNHGAPFKNAGEADKISPICDAEISLSNFMLPYTEKDSGIPRDRLIITGFPRNDYLLDNSSRKLKTESKFKNYNKIIVWMPTFRQSWHNDRVDCDSNLPLGIPIIENYTQLSEINQIMEEKDSLLVIKVHFAQDVSYIKNKNFRHLIFLGNDDLQRLNLQLYQFLSFTDALITDYSSIYFDYLLMNKPIALTIDDINQYSEKTGFVYDDYFSIIKGEYIRNIDELKHFLSVTCFSNSAIDNEHDEIVGQYHDYYDSDSSKRVLDYLLENEII
jgi:CDP-glycerol glycerophosphotransferase (TagB/SpsB family)